MKIFATQQKRTPQGRRKSQQNNRQRSYSDHKRKQNQEIPVKQQKTKSTEQHHVPAERIN